MNPEKSLFFQLASMDNLFTAFLNAGKNKSSNSEVAKFRKELRKNLADLRLELLAKTYLPKPLTSFIIKDPKTRKISKSDFRDRVIHHALCNIIEPILEKDFIFDSYANRKGKGVLKTIQRFEQFKRKVSKNNHHKYFVLKADIYHYFEQVSHDKLMELIRLKIQEPEILWLIETILCNYSSGKKCIGMPLGNLTSQFFANVYLNELDQFVKHKLKAKFYLRYVDDFVILHRDPKVLQEDLQKISHFLTERLSLKLHPDKSRIILNKNGVSFLGYRIFPCHRLLKAKAVRRFYLKLNQSETDFHSGLLSYEQIYDFFESWISYSKNAKTYYLRRRIVNDFEQRFMGEISTKEISRGIK